MRSRVLWSSFAAVLLVACSRGGGGAAVLRVTSQQPAPRSVVPPQTPVAIAFDRELDAATLAPDAFTVRDGAGPLPGSHAYDALSRTWTWTPDDELPRGALLTADVAPSVRGAGGEALGERSWSFRVRGGIAGPAQVVRPGAVAFGVFVERFGNERARLAAGGSAWQLGPLGPGAEELTPVASIARLHVDATGGATALGWLLTPPGSRVAGVAHRPAGGSWGLVVPNPLHLSPPVTGLRLHGNAAGDVLVHATYAHPGASWSQHRFDQAFAGAPGAWFEPAPETLQADEGIAAALDESGRLAILRDDGDFVVARRYDPATNAVATFTVAQQAFARVETLAASGDGALRAVFHAPGVARQAFAPPGEGFGEPVDVPIGIPTGATWCAVPSGALAGWKERTIVRSGAGSADWESVTPADTPLAVAMSPRGEVVWLTFDLPDRWLLTRWRAGEDPDPPLPVASVASAFAADRSGAVSVDAAGRVTVAFVPGVPGDLVAVVVE